MADVWRVGDHVGAVDVIDGLAFRKSSQVPVVKNLIAQLGLRERESRGAVTHSPERAAGAPVAAWTVGPCPGARLRAMGVKGKGSGEGVLMVTWAWVPQPHHGRSHGPKEVYSLILCLSSSRVAQTVA